MQARKTLLPFLMLFIATAIFAQKDTLYSSVGDVLVGEIKSMNRNVLTFDTDYADSDFKIDWDNVAGVKSNTLLIIYTDYGERYTGYLNYQNNDERYVYIRGSLLDKKVYLHNIVEITTLNKDFLSRIYISIDAGYSFSKANHLTQLTSNSHVKYKSDKWRLTGNFKSVFTSQDEVEPTNRTEGETSFAYDLMGKSFAFIGMEFLKNSEQMLDLRTTSKAGVGYYIVRTNQLFFQGGIGMANANEKYGGDEPSTTNSFEGLGLLEFDAFDIGDFSFRTKVSAYPSFTNWGRIRINGDVSLKWNLPLDFYVKASYSHNFDSHPLIDVPRNDYVFQTSIGWEWD